MQVPCIGFDRNLLVYVVSYCYILNGLGLSIHLIYVVNCYCTFRLVF